MDSSKEEEMLNKSIIMLKVTPRVTFQGAWRHCIMTANKKACNKLRNKTDTTLLKV
ncbi:hypothetical protein GCM10023142_33130 [Anaerocolumna aminovalerica]|jgi:hypothetical protein